MQENTDLQALGKELIVFNNELNQEVSTTLIICSNNRMSIKRKIALIGMCKHPNYIKYNRTTHYEKDCWERNPEGTLKNISNRIHVRKKQKTTRSPI